VGLVVRPVGNELVVYDQDRHEAHCLNTAAALVFRRCDGQTTVSQLTDRLRHELAPEVDDHWVELALDGLQQANLLTADGQPGPPPVACGTELSSAEPSRRVLLRQMGVGAALLLPAVVSVLAPTPAEAAATCLADTECPGNDSSPCYIIDPDLDCPTCTCMSGTCGCP
jgi:hypothetical protein